MPYFTIVRSTPTPTFKTAHDAYKWLIGPVSTKFGAPIGRHDEGNEPSGRVFDRYVPINSGGYDRGGAYWGISERLRVRFTLDCSYVRFYREHFEYEVQQLSPGYGWEMVTTERQYTEARARLAEYRENQPEFRYRVQRVRILPA